MPTELVTHKVCGTNDLKILRNIDEALKRGLRHLVPKKGKGTVAIVGGGPSLSYTWGELKYCGLPIMALNGAHNFLTERDVYPTFAVMMDARARQARFWKNPNPYTIYLPCANCDPTVFDVLEDSGARTALWFAWMGIGEPNNTLRIGGGSTIGMRAIYLAAVMGFEKAILYGFDGCKSEEKTHAYSQPRADHTEVHDVWVDENNKYKCTPAMCAQAGDFRDMLKVGMPIDLEFRGDGLLSAIWDKAVSLRRQENSPRPEAVETSPHLTPGGISKYDSY